MLYRIDMENMFALLATNASIKDKSGAKQLVLGPATVEFRTVTFEYSLGSPVLQSASFVCQGGRTTAFVGATGSGGHPYIYLSACILTIVKLCTPQSITLS